MAQIDTDLSRAARFRWIALAAGGLALLAVIATIAAFLAAADARQQVINLNNTQTPVGATLIAANTLAYGATFSLLEINRYSTLHAVDVIVPIIGTQTPGVFEPTLTQMAILNLHDPTLPENQMTDTYGVEMVYVPPGCFFMGRDGGTLDEQSSHEICLNAFWIDKYEVTNAQFTQLDGTAEFESHFCDSDLNRTITDGERADCGQHPRETIDWFEARDFCEKRRSARLPTEAEWEYAARGPDSMVYPWGNTFVGDNVVYSRNSGSQTAPVGSKPGGASWVGALDLSGNVYEWVSSLYTPYPYKADDGREDTLNGTDLRVLRGGAWNLNPNYLRSANRDWLPPDKEGFNTGFRCARDAA